MNRRQRNILIDFATVIIITIAAVVGMVNFKDYVNRSEALQAMNQLSRIVLEYRKMHGSTPPESYINDIKEDLKGKARFGNLQYRARWLYFDARPDEILAYVKKDYHSFIMHSGYIVLRLDGRVEWMEPKKFDELFAKQLKPLEKELLKK